MTLESTLSKKTYYGNGLTRFFPIPFSVVEKDHIFLIKKTNTENIMINDNYDVDLENMQVEYPLGGTNLASGEQLIIYRKLPLNQIVDLENSGAFHPKVLEKDGFDRLVMQIQQVAEEVDRSFKVEITDDRNPAELVTDLFNAQIEANNSANIATQEAQRAKDFVDSGIINLEQNRLDAIASITAQENSSVQNVQTQEQTSLDLLAEQVEIATNQASLATQKAINAEQSAQTSLQSIDLAQSWAIDSYTDRPEGSAKYWAGRAKDTVQAPPFFNGMIINFRGSFGGFDGKRVLRKDGSADENWVLCDGTNGTPNLVNRFIRGGNGANQNTTGGSNTHNHSGSVASHVLTAAQMPNHKHISGFNSAHSWQSVNGLATVAQANAVTGGGPNGYKDTASPFTSTAGSNHGHSHGLTINSASNLPSYYTLAYVMYIGE